MIRKLKDLAIYILCLLVLIAFSACQDQKSMQEIKDPPEQLIGNWVLSDRVGDGQAVKAEESIVKLTFRKNGTFQASFQGEPNQKWVEAGQGVFTYDSPLLTLYWDSGRVVPLLVKDLDSESLKLHHGRTMIPLKDQEADEVFQRIKTEKGPTRGPS